MPHTTSLLRRPEVERRIGRSRASVYADIAAGLLPRPVKIGQRAVAWPSHEIDAVINALTAGATPEEMYALVNQLHAARTVTESINVDGICL